MRSGPSSFANRLMRGGRAPSQPGTPLAQRARSVETPSSSRPTKARIDRPHRPAPRCDPERLSVSGRAEPLGASASHARCKGSATPEAMRFLSTHRLRAGFLGRTPGTAAAVRIEQLDACFSDYVRGVRRIEPTLLTLHFVQHDGIYTTWKIDAAICPQRDSRSVDRCVVPLDAEAQVPRSSAAVRRGAEWHRQAGGATDTNLSGA
jgi:hypothetical protein